VGHNRWLLAVRVVAAARDSQFGALEGLQALLADVGADMKEH